MLPRMLLSKSIFSRMIRSKSIFPGGSGPRPSFCGWLRKAHDSIETQLVLWISTLKLLVVMMMIGMGMMVTIRTAKLLFIEEYDGSVKSIPAFLFTALFYST